jgi:hypothetical protein
MQAMGHAALPRLGARSVFRDAGSEDFPSEEVPVEGIVGAVSIRERRVRARA